MFFIIARIHGEERWKVLAEFGEGEAKEALASYALHANSHGKRNIELAKTEYISVNATYIWGDPFDKDTKYRTHTETEIIMNNIKDKIQP